MPLRSGLYWTDDCICPELEDWLYNVEQADDDDMDQDEDEDDE